METNVYFDLVRPYCFTTVVSSLGWYQLRFEIQLSNVIPGFGYTNGCKQIRFLWVYTHTTI